jgi:hypothetical protein
MRKIAFYIPEELYLFIKDENISLSRFVQQAITDEIVKRGKEMIDRYNIKFFKYNIYQNYDKKSNNGVGFGKSKQKVKP